MGMLTHVLVWLNGVANPCAAVLLAPVPVLPGWLSATLVAIITGVLMLLVFKYTSDQAAIKRVRSRIKANLLALSLFQDSVAVSLRSQGRLLLGACHLSLLAVVPMLVMLVPMSLLLSQLALWYQARPLRPGEEAVVTLHLWPDGSEQAPGAQLATSAAFTTLIGPVRVPQRHLVCWSIQAREPGYHRLAFQISGQTFEKELAVGNGFMRVSPRRPAWRWSEVLLYPRETPFPPDALVQTIEIAYPPRQSRTAGSNSWLVYWFAASMAAAFATRPLLRVDL